MQTSINMDANFMVFYTIGIKLDEIYTPNPFLMLERPKWPQMTH